MFSVAGGFIGLAILAVIAGLRSGMPDCLAYCAAANGLDTIADLLDHGWIGVAISGPAAILLFLLWLTFRRRKRTPKLAGAKSRARLAAVVRSLRERAKPRPVFRPQRQGA